LFPPSLKPTEKGFFIEKCLPSFWSLFSTLIPDMYSDAIKIFLVDTSFE